MKVKVLMCGPNPHIEQAMGDEFVPEHLCPINSSRVDLGIAFGVPLFAPIPTTMVLVVSVSTYGTLGGFW